MRSHAPPTTTLMATMTMMVIMVMTMMAMEVRSVAAFTAPCPWLPRLSSMPSHSLLSQQQLRCGSSSRLRADDNNNPEAEEPAAGEPTLAEVPTDPAQYADLFNNDDFWDANLDEEGVKEMLDKHFKISAPKDGFWKNVIFARTSIINAAKKEGSNEGALESTASVIQGLVPNDVTASWIMGENQDPKHREKVLVAVKRSLVVASKDRPTTLHDSILMTLGITHNTQKPKPFDMLRVGEDKSTFFFGEANFRHKGDHGQQPTKVFLKPLDLGTDRDVVAIFHTESGSGKTVELAASAHLRDAVVSVLKIIDVDIRTKESGDQRYNEAYESLTSSLKSVVQSKPIAFQTIIKEMNAWAEPTADGAKGDPESIRIVYCLDEASGCPNLVREIIRNYSRLGDEMGKYIANGCDGTIETTSRDIQVVFSVAGTGTHGNVVGSLGANYRSLEPSGRKVDKEVYEALVSEYDKGDARYQKIPSQEDLVKSTALLGIVGTHNARMASILIDQLFHSPFSYTHPHERAKLMSLVFQKFIACNGMKSLWNYNPANTANELACTKRRMRISGQSLATFLFPKPFTISPDDDKAAEKVRTLNYGIRFDGDEDPGANSNGDELTTMHYLVRKYGLVAPNDFPDGDEEDRTLDQPFEVSEAMQLLCIWLMHGGTRLADGEALLGTTPHAFEVLSTQLVSCAISAAMTVALEDRPDAHHILKKALGMFLREGTVDGKGEHGTPHVDPEIEEAWAALEDVIPVSVDYDLAFNGMYYHKSEMKLREEKKKQKEKKTTSAPKRTKTVWQNIPTMEVDRDGDLDMTDLENRRDFNAAEVVSGNTETTLVMDRDLLKGLMQMKGKNTAARRFSPALTCVVEGRCNLADGSVSFVGAKRNEKGELVDYALYTIFIQSKDLFGTTRISIGDVRQNKKRVCNELLEIPFGKKGLYCVASRLDKIPKELLKTGDVDEVNNEELDGYEVEDGTQNKQTNNKAKDTRMPFVSYPTDEGMMLPNVMLALDQLRNQQQKLDDNAVMLKFSKSKDE